MKTKIILLVVIGLALFHSCTCVRNKLEGEEMYKTIHEMRKLANIDGRAAPAGEAIHHVCPLRSYPCREP
ncbi:hypothetical protein HU200_048053 [Digitaria exilis]|uniref:Uncharacterized protein n=1 Tax=Digitaria exilis TaxID=1010633 RepID=A0A835EB64_9POAL|nr:hypothetical protein HU200_048053 [Digitaria exilis]